MNKNKDNRGFTLVEIAIVLVIIGLLLGGILKGQELINNAKVRAIADRQNSLKVAWFAFIDRYAALPGDFLQANIYISGAGKGNGDGKIAETESVQVFQHLTTTGYIRCAQCTSKTKEKPNSANSPSNTYGGVMSIWNDSAYYTFLGSSSGEQSARLMVHTGPRIPSNIIGEVDRKIDNGVPNSGDFRLNIYDPIVDGHSPPEVDKCMSDLSAGEPVKHEKTDVFFATELQWRSPNVNPPVESNCGASVFI